MQTARLKKLMEEVLDTIPTPHGEDIIEDVFCAIEQNPKWRKEYDGLQYNLGKSMVNGWGAFWIGLAKGRAPGELVSSTRSSLLDSYAKLPKGPKPALKKVKEPEALKLMSEYFFLNRETLSAEVRKHRELLLELIKAGFPPEAAFPKVLEKPSMAH